MTVLRRAVPIQSSALLFQVVLLKGCRNHHSRAAGEFQYISLWACLTFRAQASGKTSFVNVIGSGQWSEDVVPTVAFHFRKVRKGNVTLRIWDLAGKQVICLWILHSSLSPCRPASVSVNMGEVLQWGRCSRVSRAYSISLSCLISSCCSFVVDSADVGVFLALCLYPNLCLRS